MATTGTESAVAGTITTDLAMHHRPRWWGWRIPLNRVALALIAVNILWRCVRYGLGFPIWGDEAYVAINFFSRDYSQLLKPLDYSQIVPLLFLWMELLIARTLGMSEYALRLIPFLAGLASVWLFWRLLRRTLPRHFAIASLALFAASYYPVRHAAEIKAYSIDMFVALGLLHLTLNVRERLDSITRWFALCIAMVIGVWLSYPACFVAGGCMVFVGVLALRQRSTKAIVATMVSGASLIASFGTMYLLFGRAQAADGHWLTELEMWEHTFPKIARPWTLPLWFLDIHTGNLMAYPVGGNHGGSTLTFILACCGAIALWRTQRWLLLLLLSPLPLMFVAAAMEKYPYGDSARVSQHVAPAVCMLAGVGLVSTMRGISTARAAVYATRMCVGVMFVLALLGMGMDIARPHKKFSDAETKRVIQWMAEQARPGDEWLVFGDSIDTQWAPDYHGWGGAGARLRFNIARFAPVNVQWGTDPLKVDLPNNGANRLWLIVYRHSYAPFPENRANRYVEMLTRQLDKPLHMHEFPMRDPNNREVLWVYEFGPLSK